MECGAIDCLWGSFSIDGREARYRWTEPYISADRWSRCAPGQRDVVRLSDLAGKRVADSIHDEAGGAPSHADPGFRRCAGCFRCKTGN